MGPAIGVAAIPRPDVRKRAALGITSLSQPTREFLVILEAQAHQSRHAVVRGPRPMVDEILARIVVFVVGAVLYVREPDVVVNVDQGRDHSLARQVDLDDAVGGLILALPADPREDTVLDKKCGIFDGCVTIADDEPHTFEPDGVSRRLWRLGLG